MGSLARNLSYAARSLARTPLFTSGVVLTLGLGIGANAAMFGVVDVLFLRPPERVRYPERVARVYIRRILGSTGRSVTTPTTLYESFTRLRDAGVFEQTAAVTVRTLSLGRGTDATPVRAALVSHDYFPLLGIAPALGRFFGAEEDRRGAEGSAVISYGLWKRHFAGDTSLLGRSFPIGDATYTVVGVAPRGFVGIDLSPVEVWLPVEVAALPQTENWTPGGRPIPWVQVVGRLATGQRPENVASRATLPYRRGAVARFAGDSTAQVQLGPIQEARAPRMGSDATVSVWVTAIAAVVLLIACANVANLLLARFASRRREFAVRAALGAGRGSLAWLALSESLILSGIGGAAALLLAAVGGGVIRGFLIPNLPADLPVVDMRVLALTGTLVLTTAVLTGLGPAVQLSGTKFADALGASGHQATPRHEGVRTVLITVQVALALVLLFGAGLFVRSLRNVESVDLGFDADHVLVASVDLNGTRATPEAIDAVYLGILDRLQRLPGVERAAGSGAPFGTIMLTTMRVEGWATLPHLPVGGPFPGAVTPGYFATLGTRLLSGRDFTPQDRLGSEPAAIINATMARSLWRDAALGKCLYFGEPARPEGSAPPCTQVVGVVADAHETSVVGAVPMQVFLPYGQMQVGGHLGALYVRVSGDATTLIASVRRAFAQQGDLPYADVRLLADLIAPQRRSWKLGAVAFSAFAALALLIAALGVFAVIGYWVSQRTREIGIRMALGARTGQVALAVLAQGARPTAIGIVLGAAGAYALGRGIRSLLYQVGPADPHVFLYAVGLLLAVAMTAAYLPALRATKVDPVLALRSE